MNRENPLKKLQELGQSVWLDFIRRPLLESGEFGRLIHEDGLSGVTSNPTIFEKAIGGSGDYDTTIEALAHQDKSSEQIFQALEVEDIQHAADLLRPVYDRLEGRDGYASIEVSPRLARDTAGTIAEATRLWDATARPNIFVKVPATREGLPAIRQLISEGINVNVTLLFGLSRYYEVAQACLEGQEALAQREHSLERVASVASFFLSRIDVLIDPQLEEFIRDGGKQGDLAGQLRGKAAVASAKVAYQVYKEVFGAPRFRALAERGARPQRLLWASTSTKTPGASDVKYVDSIIAPETINTMPLETLNAYRDHGQPEVRILDGVSESYWVLERLGYLGLEVDILTQQLEDEGIAHFARDYDKLLDAIEKKRQAALEGHPLPQRRAA